MMAACTNLCPTADGCGCMPLFMNHWSWHELQAIARALDGDERAPRLALELITVLRDPVERVISEYQWLRSMEGRRQSISQDHWDYLDASTSVFGPGPIANLSAAGRCVSRDKLCSLGQFVEQTPGIHPALNRQVRYVAGFPRMPWAYGSKSCCHKVLAKSMIAHARKLRGAGAEHRVAQLMAAMEREAKASSASTLRVTQQHLDQAIQHLKTGLLGVGVLERLEETAELFEYQLGWPRNWTIFHYKRLSGDKRMRGARHIIEQNATLLSRIRELNGLDEHLYRVANELLTERLAVVRALPRESSV
jgi:hypothetical protein